MEVLIQQELALHKPDVRKNISQIRQLLHVDFQEVGASGETYSKDSIIALMDAEPAATSHIHAQGFETVPLSDRVYLLLYKSCLVQDGNRYDNFAKRSSIWVNENEVNGSRFWQIKYHQGTPCPAFDIQDS